MTLICKTEQLDVKAIDNLYKRNNSGPKTMP